MKYKNILGIALILIGGAMWLLSDYIAQQVVEGKLQIQSGQAQVEQVETLFSMSKYTKPFAKTVTGSANQQIAAGQSEIDKYEAIEKKLEIGGIVLIILGVVVLFFPGGKKKRSI